MGWFRAHDGISTDVKYPAVADRCGQPVERVMAVWLHVLDEANKADDRGEVNIDAEAFASFLRCQPEDVEAILEAMRRPRRDGTAGMLDGNRVSNWRKRNPLREDDTAAERKRRQRDRAKAEEPIRDEPEDPDSHDMSRDVTHGHAASRQTDRQTEETDRKKESAPNGAYRWRGSIIRLKEPDYDRWAAAFHAVDLPAQLLTIDQWLASDEAKPAQRKNWFNLVAGTLRKRHEAALADARAGPGLQVKSGYGFGIV